MSLLVLAALALGAQPAEPVMRGSTLFAVDPRTEQRYPTVRVPYRPDAICYEWVVFFETENREVKVRELVELPAAPVSWGDVAALGVTVAADGRSAVSELSDSIADSQISRRWCVGAGDPLGPYRIRVYLGEQLLEDFQFEMVADSE
jgi:hypothetical protein